MKYFFLCSLLTLSAEIREVLFAEFMSPLQLCEDTFIPFYLSVNWIFTKICLIFL